MKWIISILNLWLAISINVFAKTNQPTPIQTSNQISSVKILFDVKRVNSPTVLQYAKRPSTWRAYLPTCPAGSRYVSGVNANMPQLDYPPNYPYCNCICNGNCGSLNGVTAPSGLQQPVYSATVTCAANVQGWHDVYTANLVTAPHQYYYCQSGSCTTNPLPAQMGYSVPIGNNSNVKRIDFLACQIAAKTGCGNPDPISLSRQ